MHTFKVKILTSPGIRKDVKEEQELGEDAAGFVSVNDYAILWIADGAPGTKIKLNGIKFSSRTLAQCMGECFERVTLEDERPKKPLNDEFLVKFVCELRKQLLAKLEDLNKQLQYFTNWIEKSFSFIPISKYFRLNV